jgi:hypothetical protein
MERQRQLTAQAWTGWPAWPARRMPGLGRAGQVVDGLPAHALRAEVRLHPRGDLRGVARAAELTVAAAHR